MGSRVRIRSRPVRAVLVAFLAALLTAAGAGAQLGDVLPPTIEFNLSNPGARSMGFGGAFAALADDATAAFANPAGLVQLTEPEVSIEGRSWSYATDYVAGGRIFGEPFGIGLDTAVGLRAGRSARDLSGLSFLSVVYPKDRWSLAIYRHQLASFEFRGELQGLFSGPWPGAGVRRELDYRRTADLDVRSYAVAGAYRLTEALSVGLGLARFEGTLTALAETYGLVCGGPDIPPCPPSELASFFSERPLVPERLWASYLLASDDTDWALTAGFLWTVSGRWRLGGFYRQGPELGIRAEIRSGPAFGPAAAGALLAADSSTARFPEVFGLGFSYRTGERFTVSLEWDRVGYADLSVEAAEGSYPLADGDELRLGAEYVFLGRTPIAALRLGVWRDPDHRYSYRGDDYRARAVFPPGDDELHYAAGLGVACQRVQLDLGVDLSDPLDTVSLSTVFRF